jgi:hypothetical protein
VKQDVAEVKMSIYTKGPSFTTRRRLISVWTVSLLGMVCEKMTERVEVVREPEDDSLFIMNR